MIDLYDWQKRVIAEAPERPKRALFAAPRLGKTLATTIMLRDSGASPAVILAPLSVCGAWMETLQSEGFDPYPLYLRGGADAYRVIQGNPGVVVLNYDKLPPILPALQAWKPKGLIFDESHLLKNPQSARSKAARKLAGRGDFTRILTGTPSPNHYGDLWAQLVLVNPERWGKWSAFAQRFLIRDAIYPSRIIGHHNVPELREMLRADADIIRREDVFGPDTYQYIERSLDLPRKAREVYDTLVKEWLYYHERGEVLADHALKRLVRLQQLTSGYLRTEDGQDIPIHTAKIDAVMADLEEIIESGEKATIFHRFSWEGEQYEHSIRERFPRAGMGRIHGGSSPGEREAAIRLIHTNSDSAIVVAQTRTAALGVSFAEATHALFVSESFSFTDEEQARDRIYKPGFNRCITHYRCENTVDTFIAGVLASKGSIHEAVTHADIREMAFGRIRR